MTRDEAKQLLPIIQAYSEGKEVEFCRPYSSVWMAADEPEFTNSPACYRIKPEPVECWAVVTADNSVIQSYFKRANADQHAAASYNFRVIRMREVCE